VAAVTGFRPLRVGLRRRSRAVARVRPRASARVGAGRVVLRAGQSGGDGDEVPAQGGAAGDGVPTFSEGAGGAEQVVGDRCADGPRGVGRELAGG
jgi:hypothetical protein